MADWTTDPEGKRTLLYIAKSYTRLAERAERRLSEGRGANIVDYIIP